jgi:long-chain acyl-CoA synthetase
MTEMFTTLPGLLKYVERNFRNECALGYKQAGSWRKISTASLGDTVRKLSQGMVALGMRPGDKVGIVADPSPFWVMMDLAILGAGGISVPMFANISPENLQYEIKDSGMRFLVVGSDAQHQAMKPFFGSLEKIILLNTGADDPKCVAYDKVIRMGEERQASHPGEYLRLSEGINEQDTATIIYTSGSTGTPKGVELTHRNLCSQVLAAGKRFPLDPSRDSIVSCLPLAHVFERMVCYYYLYTGCSVHFAEEVKKVGDALRELSPTVVTLVPRLLEKAHAKFQANVETATGLKRKLALGAWQRALSKDPAAPKSLKDKLFDTLVYKKMRAAMGGRLRLVISGSAPLDPALNAFFINIGIEVYEGYGLTESSPVIACNFPGHRKLGTVGLAFPGVEVKIADDGEILTRGPNVMKGYYNKPAETGESVDKQGWLHTGDLGHIDAQGYIKITGRKKELFKTANGKYVAPVPIEQAIASSNKLVDMAMVIAEGKNFTTCLIFPDFENLQAIKKEFGRDGLGNEEFLSSSETVDFVKKTIDEVNAKLNHWEQVQKFVIAKAPITVEAGQLTPTMKIRRHVVTEKFKAEIESMYRAS